MKTTRLGAYGHFTLQHDVTAFTDLRFYARVGERTKVFVLFVRRAPIFMVPRPRDITTPALAHAARAPERELWETPWDHFSLLSTAPAVYGSQTARWTNDRGETFWARKHFELVEPIPRPPLTHERTPSQIEACWLRSLARAIDLGRYPRWRVSVQLVRIEAADRIGWHPFDSNRPWPFLGAPLYPLGRLVLDRAGGTRPARVPTKTVRRRALQRSSP